MGETTDQIESYIDNKREVLGSNLQELETKVKSMTDWRQQFQSKPMRMIGVAFGGGILLAFVLGGRKRKRAEALPTSPHALASSSNPATDQEKHKARDTWDNIQGALIGVAATQFKGFLADIIPGFHEQVREAESRKLSASRPNA